MFTAKSLQSRWYIVAGNHDHIGNAGAQIEYTKKSHRWYMLSYCYTEVTPLFTIMDNPYIIYDVFQVFRIGSNVTIQFVFIDTQLLTASDLGCLPSNDSGPQWIWIENTLAASTSLWLFVLGHHPGKKIINHLFYNITVSAVGKVKY